MDLLRSLKSRGVHQSWELFLQTAQFVKSFKLVSWFSSVCEFVTKYLALEIHFSNEDGPGFFSTIIERVLHAPKSN